MLVQFFVIYFTTDYFDDIYFCAIVDYFGIDLRASNYFDPIFYELQ